MCLSNVCMCLYNRLLYETASLHAGQSYYELVNQWIVVLLQTANKQTYHLPTYKVRINRLRVCLYSHPKFAWVSLVSPNSRCRHGTRCQTGMKYATPIVAPVTLALFPAKPLISKHSIKGLTRNIINSVDGSSRWKKGLMEGKEAILGNSNSSYPVR